MLRMSRGSRLTPVGWQEALTTFTERFKAIQAKHGPASVAFLGGSQNPVEELAFFGALAKFGMGMRHGGDDTLPCLANTAAAYQACFGVDALPTTLGDLEESDVLIFVGTDPCVAHPELWERVLRNPHDPRVVVIDSRSDAAAELSPRYVPIAPESDVEFFHAVAHVLIREGWLDDEFVTGHTDHFEAFAAHVLACSPEQVAPRAGVSAALLEELARIIHRGKRVSIWWTTGVSQNREGVHVAHALIALCLLTGNIGRRGTGPHAICGQGNVMGARLFGNTTTLLGGHGFDDPAHREKVASALAIDAAAIPTDAGMTYDQILEGIRVGEIKGLWVVASNPAHSWAKRADARDVLGRLEFLVVQDTYDASETAAMADLILPAGGWGEREGCFIDAAREVSVVKRVAHAPGTSVLSDFRAFQRIADSWGCGLMFRGWSSTEAVFQIVKSLTHGMPFDFSGVDGRALDSARGTQRPPSAARPSQRPEPRRIFDDRRFHTASGRAVFVFDPPDTRSKKASHEPYAVPVEKVAHHEMRR